VRRFPKNLPTKDLTPAHCAKPLYQDHIRDLHHEINCYVGPTQQQGELPSSFPQRLGFLDPLRLAPFTPNPTRHQVTSCCSAAKRRNLANGRPDKDTDFKRGVSSKDFRSHVLKRKYSFWERLKKVFRFGIYRSSQYSPASSALYSNVKVRNVTPLTRRAGDGVWPCGYGYSQIECDKVPISVHTFMHLFKPNASHSSRPGD
jgi:hypothetical protein